MSATPMSATPTKRALLIGVDEYEFLGERHQLKGCAKDAKLIGSVLQENFGFPEDNIRMLTNGDATQEGILAAFDQLVEDTVKDDIVVVHYSGHGSQMLDLEGDEPDGWDETIMPTDSGRRPHENRDITDDRIHLFLLALGEKTSNITLIFDCCHSGTISRDPFFGGAARSAPRDDRSAEELTRSALPAEEGAKLKELGKSGSSGWFKLAGKYVLIAGCRDEELSYEYEIKADGDKGATTHGALTYFLTQSLVAAESGTTYQDIYERVSLQVNGANTAQHPQIEGARDRILFDVEDAKPSKYIRILSRDGNQVTLDGGLVHGLTRGSEWTVHPAGARPSGENQIGRISLEDLSVATTMARIVEEDPPGAIEAAARAAPAAKAWGTMTVAVKMAGDETADPDAWGKMVQALGASEYLECSDQGRDYCVYLLPQRTEVGDDAPVPQVGPLSSPTWAVVDSAGDVIMPPKAMDDVATIIKNLEGWATYRFKLGLENPTSDLKDKVWIELVRLEGDEWVIPDPDPELGVPVLEIGDQVNLRIKSTASEPLFLGVFDFGLKGGVSQIYPPAGAHEALSPTNDGKYVYYDGKQGVSPAWPSGFPFAPNPFLDEPTDRIETIKLFATSVETDFRYLEQDDSTRSAAAVPKGIGSHPLHALMEAASRGGKTREMPVSTVEEDDEWVTSSVAWVLRPARESRVEPNAKRATNVAGVLVKSDADSLAAGRFRPESTPDSGEPVDPFERALAEADARTLRSIAVGGQDDETGSRSVARGGVTVEVPAPADGWGQAVVSRDASGLTRWHFPAEDGDASRAATGTRSAGTQRFQIEVANEPVAELGDEPPARGLTSLATRKLLKVVAYRLLDPVAGFVADKLVSHWEERKRPAGLRTFTPENYQHGLGDPIEGDSWRHLQAGPALLFVHGTFSRANHAFNGLTPEWLSQMHERYEGRVFAFDHPTVSIDPKENIEWLVDQLPSECELDLDIICHSRGGLVSRVLAERGTGLAGRGRRLDVNRVVFAGSPNAGTAIADPKHMKAFLDTYTNVFQFADFLPDPGIVDTLEAVITVAKQAAVGALGGLKGIHSMVPGGPFEEWLAASPDPSGTQYFALSSNFAPQKGALKALMADRVMDQIFGGAPNDLVVPADSVYGGPGGPFPIQEHARLNLTEYDSVGHSDYFGTAIVRDKILEWLPGASAERVA